MSYQDSDDFRARWEADLLRDAIKIGAVQERPVVNSIGGGTWSFDVVRINSISPAPEYSQCKACEVYALSPFQNFCGSCGEPYPGRSYPGKSRAKKKAEAPIGLDGLGERKLVLEK